MTRFSQGAAQRTDSPNESQRLASWYTPGLSDAIGDRLLMFDNSTSSSLELLRFRPELGKAAGFEDALRKRVEELENFTHPSIAKVRAVEMLGEEDGLALVSNHTVGRRLSEIQQEAHGPQFATELVSQLVPVLAALQEQGQGVAHGLLTPERVIVTPEGRLVLSEHVLASAVDALRLTPERLRDDLGLVVPAGTASLDDPRADVVQLGYLALSLLVGRRVRSLDAAREIVGRLNRQSPGQGRDAPRYLQRWLVRALQVDGSPFESANDAERALTEWPEHERASADHLPREVAAPPVTARVTPKPAASKPVASEPPPQPVRPPQAAPTPQARPESFEPEAPSPFEPEAPSPFVEPEPLVVGSLLGLRQAPVSRPPIPPIPLIGEPLLQPVARVVPAPEPVREAPQPVREAPEWPKRPKQEPIRFHIEPEPAPKPEVQRAIHRDVAPAPRPRRQRSVAQWLVAGLSFVCFVESLIIAGLLASRAVTTTTTATERAPAAATARATAPLAPPVASVASRPAPPPAVPTVNDVKPAPTTPAAPVTLTRGWLTIEAPFELQIFEGTTLLGSTKSERLSLLAGPHDLRLASAALNFETTIQVEIPAGVGITTRVAAPNGTLSLHATPWANVSLDGKSLGTTPVMNLAVPVGSHEVIWRHPQLGERRQTTVVTAKGPVSLAIDLRR